MNQQVNLQELLTTQTDPASLCHSLHCLLLGWVYYAVEQGLCTQELMQHYENGQSLLQLFQHLAAHSNGTTPTQTAA